MKKNDKKIQSLRLSSESIRSLSAVALEAAGGGGYTDGGDSCGANGCRNSYGQCTVLTQ